MNPRPLRLPPGVDLRRELERLVADGQLGAGFVVAGIGSLDAALLRFAGDEATTVLPGPHELLTLSGSLSADGAHLHATVADTTGQVHGGHLAYGNTVRTTAELLLLAAPDWQMNRRPDPGTGHAELTLRPV